MSAVEEQLNKLNERAKDLSENPSELAKDALLADVRAFYDAVKGMKIVAKKAAAPKAAKAAPVAKPEPVTKPEPVVAAKPEPAAKPAAFVKPTPEPVAKAAPEPVKEEVVEKAPEPVAEKPVVKEKAKPAKEPMIAEKQVEEGDSNEKILAGQFNKTPLADLRSGIPLNEKFGIIRNLFKGNASDFGDAVLKLNNAANAKEMTHYMELLNQRFSWDEETEAYKNFVGYVERKMMTLKPSNADADQ